jgi:hypothetical protein
MEDLNDRVAGDFYWNRQVLSREGTARTQPVQKSGNTSFETTSNESEYIGLRTAIVPKI